MKGSKTHDPNHQMAKALMRLMNFIAEDPTSVKYLFPAQILGLKGISHLCC